VRRRGLRRALLAAVAGGLLAGALAASGEGDEGYLVRAVFDNASFVIPGEDVRVAWVTVGKIADVELTPGNRAAVVLEIDDPAFAPFRRDAHCQIRLQSLIGEQYVQCEPTQVREGGGAPPRPLGQIESGTGEGQHLLPVENTTTPVALDLITNIQRLPQRERLRLIIGELGAGVAGNGERLRGALRRANPALRELNKVVAVLAGQDRLLARLVDGSDRVLEPWAKRRRETAGFIDHAGATAVATAERGEDLERDFERLPPFLRELEPTAQRLDAFGAQAIPALASLQAQAPAINATVERLGPFSAAATPALASLGDFAARGRQVLPRIQPLVRDVGELARPARPAVHDLAALLSSFDESGGIEELMRFIFFYTSAINGEDRLGHYARGGLNVSACSARVGEPPGGCFATFDTAGAGSAAVLDYLLGPDEGGSR
jgi:ABC-type transporter Mla subunit MlaD